MTINFKQENEDFALISIELESIPVNVGDEIELQAINRDPKKWNVEPFVGNFKVLKIIKAFTKVYGPEFSTSVIFYIEIIVRKIND